MKRVVAALFFFGISFGYVEAAVVAYLRALYEPMRQAIYSNRSPGDLFPLIRLDQLDAAGPEHMRRLSTELVREAATLIMLAAVALAVARSAREWIAAFAIAFGVWDISFYAFLRVLLGWPESLLTWDVLFLIPVPWAAPVLAPVLASVSMIAAGLLLLWRECVGSPLPWRWYHWAGVFAGGLVLVLAFTWDFHNTSAGGMPNPFHWPLFVAGEIIGLGAFMHAFTRPACGITQPGGKLAVRR